MKASLFITILLPVLSVCMSGCQKNTEVIFADPASAFLQANFEVHKAASTSAQRAIYNGIVPYWTRSYKTYLGGEAVYITPTGPSVTTSFEVRQKKLLKADTQFLPLNLPFIAYLVTKKSNGQFTAPEVLLFIASGSLSARQTNSIKTPDFKNWPAGISGVLVKLSPQGKLLQQFSIAGNRWKSRQPTMVRAGERTVAEGECKQYEVLYRECTYVDGLLTGCTPWEVIGYFTVGDCSEEGGGGDSGENEAECDVSKFETNTNFSSATDLIEELKVEDKPQTRVVQYKWRCVIMHSMGSSANVFSHETGIHVKPARSWKWQSLTHNGISLQTTSVAVTFEASEVQSQVILGEYTSLIALTVNCKATLSCIPGVQLAIKQQNVDAIMPLYVDNSEVILDL
jgi:hypothetical protein